MTTPYECSACGEAFSGAEAASRHCAVEHPDTDAHVVDTRETGGGVF